jgi:hypothetical protein
MWDNLLTALVSGSLVIAGVIFTQRGADQREDRRWGREREHEKAVWDRDDAARSYDHRRKACMDFLNDYLIKADAIAWAEVVYEGDAPEDWLEPMRRQLGEVQVFGTRAAFNRATEAYALLHRWCYGPREDAPTWDDVVMAKDAYVDQVRRDLHVSDE